MLLILLLNTSPVQNYLAKRATSYLSERIKSPVSLKNVRIDFFNRAVLEGLFVGDSWGDTLLYAGEAQLRITDFFFLKDDVTISYVGLKDAYIHIYRKDTDSIWNYQFLADAFKSGKKKDKKDSKMPQWDLDKINLENVRFHNIDAWAGSDMIAELGSFTIKAKDIDPTKKIIALKSIDADKVTYGLRNYKSAKGYKRWKPRVNADVFDLTPFNKGLWTVTLDDFELKRSRFFLENPDAEHQPPGEFDPKHMNVTDIHLIASKLRIDADTIKGKMNLLQLKEQSGVEIQKMTADVTVSPKISECKNLYLKTNRSELKNYYAMHYRHFPDFTDYLNRVKMVADLSDSKVDMKDIIFFAPKGLHRFSTAYSKVEGHVEGTISDLNTTNFFIDDGHNILSGNFSITGIPDMNKAIIVLEKGDITTDAKGLLTYFPEIHVGDGFNLTSLGRINYKGNFKGHYNDFNIAGIANTALGSVDVNLNLKHPESDFPAYSGKAITQAFDMGTFLRQPKIGNIAFDLKLDGTGFKPQVANAKLDGVVHSFLVNDYLYKNIEVHGKLERMLFNGKLHVNDENLNMNFDGIVDYSKPTPTFNLTANLAYFDFKNLNFSKQNIYGKADVSLDFVGNNIDNFEGIAQLDNVNLYKDSSLLSIDALTLQSSILSEKEKRLELQTNGVDAIVVGDFKLLDLPNSFQYFLSYYLPQYIKPPRTVNTLQKFRYSIKLQNTDDILSMFVKDWSVGSGTEMFGLVDMPMQQLTLNAYIPTLKIGSNIFNETLICSNGTKEDLYLESNTERITSGKKTLVSSAQLRANIFNDTANFKIVTTSSNQLGNATLNGKAFAADDYFHLIFKPSEFFLSNTRWQVESGNETIFGKDYVDIQNFVLNSGQQSIKINHQGSATPNEAKITFKNIGVNAVNDFIPNDSLNFYGNLSGTALVKPLMSKQVATFDLRIDSLKLNNDTMGVMNLVGKFDVPSTTLHFDKGSGLTYGDSKLFMEGKWNFNTAIANGVNGVIRLSDTKLSLAQPFLYSIFRDIKGTLNGDIYVTGNSAKPLIAGMLKMKGGGFTPIFTGVDYTMDEGTISVSDEKVDIGTIILKDPLGNEGYLNGIVTHKNLFNWRFNLRLNSDKIQALDLTDKQGPYFYGDVKTAAQMRLTGPIDDISINITATPLKDSKLFIPISDGLDLSEYKFISFKSMTAKQDSIYTIKNRFHLRIDAIVTPDIETTIIIDKRTGDQIWAKGSGSLVLEVPSEGDLKLNGNYVIEDGRYNFAFKQLEILNYKRQFQIYPNSIIKWNGSISGAELDVRAMTQIKARLYDLIINDVDRMAISDGEIRDAQLKQDVDVNMNMTGNLSEPEFKFSLALAENRSVGTYAYQKLQRINTDDNELLNQVSSLLLLDQFLPPEGFNSTALQQGTINNMSELFSTFASSQLTNFASRVLGFNGLSVGVRYRNYNLNNNNSPITPGDINRNEAGLNLRKNFFNNRLIVELGGVYDWGRVSSRNTQFTSNLAGDFRVQYLLTADGRLRMNLFSNSNYDPIYQQNVSRNGLGISYRKSFNSVLEFFRKNEEATLHQEREHPLKKDTNLPIEKSSDSSNISAHIFNHKDTISN